MLSNKEMEQKYLEDNKTKEALIGVLKKMAEWVEEICTQKWPYEGCPRGAVYHFAPFEDVFPEAREFADKIYGRYLDEIDSRRSA